MKQVDGSEEVLYFPIDVRKYEDIDKDEDEPNFVTFRSSLKVKKHHIQENQNAVYPIPVIQVYMVLDNNNRALITETNIDMKNVEEQLDVTPAVNHWLSSPDKNLGFIITCDGCRDSNIDLELSSSFLNVNLHHRAPRFRSKRSIDLIRTRRHQKNCRGGGRHKKTCCRRKMKISFKDLPGFEWVKDPVEFEAFMCKGKCRAKFNPGSNHALLQGLMHSKSRQSSSNKNKRKRIPSPCCVPSKLRDLPILHLDENNKLKTTEWKGVIVSECMCA